MSRKYNGESYREDRSASAHYNNERAPYKHQVRANGYEVKAYQEVLGVRILVKRPRVWEQTTGPDPAVETVSYGPNEYNEPRHPARQGSYRWGCVNAAELSDLGLEQLRLDIWAWGGDVVRITAAEGPE